MLERAAPLIRAAFLLVIISFIICYYVRKKAHVHHQYPGNENSWSKYLLKINRL